MRILYCLALLAFCVFWIVSTPIYFLTTLLEAIDVRLGRLLDELWEGLW